MRPRDPLSPWSTSNYLIQLLKKAEIRNHCCPDITSMSQIVYRSVVIDSVKYRDTASVFQGFFQFSRFPGIVEIGRIGDQRQM